MVEFHLADNLRASEHVMMAAGYQLAVAEGVVVPRGGGRGAGCDAGTKFLVTGCTAVPR